MPEIPRFPTENYAPITRLPEDLPFETSPGDAQDAINAAAALQELEKRHSDKQTNTDKDELNIDEILNDLIVEDEPSELSH